MNTHFLSFKNNPLNTTLIHGACVKEITRIMAITCSMHLQSQKTLTTACIIMPVEYLCHMVSRQQGWQNRSGQSSLGQTTFLASRSHDTRTPQRFLRIPVWNSYLQDVTYQTSLSANLHVLSISRARWSRKPQSGGSEARRCYKSPSRQLKNDGEKIFHVLHAFDFQT